MEAEQDTQSRKRYHGVALGLITMATLVRVVYLTWFCPLDLAPDEAHYWDWSRHLDWCYYSKGPLVAWLIRLSCDAFGPLAQALCGNEMPAVRLPAVLCGSLILAGFYSLTNQIYGSPRLALVTVVMAMTLPLVAAGSTLMTIDAPFACAWMWALVFAHRAVFRGSGWAWLAAGLCIALGVLSKHTMVLWVPSFALFLLATPAVRKHLKAPGFWIMTGIGALGGVPILLWNAMNGWVTFHHTQGHAGVKDGLHLYWLGPLTYLGMQVGVMLIFWFVVWVRAMWEHRPTRDARPEFSFLWWMSAPTFIFFWLFSFINGGGEPNWPLTAYASGGVLAAGWLARELGHPRPWRAWFTRVSMGAAVSVAVLLTLVAHEPVQAQPILLRLAGPATPQRPNPLRRIDPTCRLRGWRHLASEVDRLRTELRARGIDPVLAAARWTHASEAAFYGKGHPKVYCLGLALGDRDSQFDVWRPNPVADFASFQGRTFLLVDADVDRLRSAFDSIEPVRWVIYSEGGQTIASWQLAVAHGYRGIRSGD